MLPIRIGRTIGYFLAGGLLLLVACVGFTLNLSFIVPERAESTETLSYSVEAGTTVEVANDIGSTRVIVDPQADTVSVEVKRIALSDTQSGADELLERMVVTVTEPQADGDSLLIEAIKPATATDDEDNFQFNVEDDQINIVAIVGSAEVAQYQLRVTLPAGHPLVVEQGVGRVRAVGLDTAATLSAESGTVHTLSVRAPLTVTVEAGGVNIEAHVGSLDVEVGAGSADLEIVSLAAADAVTATVTTGGIDCNLPEDIDADLRALVDLGAVVFEGTDFIAVSDLTETSNFVEAVLNAGGPSIDLRVDLGDIDIDSF